MVEVAPDPEPDYYARAIEGVRHLTGRPVKWEFDHPDLDGQVLQIFEAPAHLHRPMMQQLQYFTDEIEGKLGGSICVIFYTPKQTRENHAADSPCIECPWRQPCFEGCRTEKWSDKDKTPLTSVHTCCTCMLKSITFYSQLESGEVRGAGGEVPDDCPRWQTLQGSGLDCDICENERRAIRKRHPANQDYTEHLMKVFGDIGKKPRDDLSTRRSIRKMVEAASPMKAWGEDFAHPSPTLKRTDRIFQAVQKLASDDKALGELVNEWQRGGEKVSDRWQYMLATWAEAIYFAIQEHGTDADQVTREFFLAYTNGAARRSWSRASLEDRRQKLQRWKEYIGQALNLETAIE